MPIYIFHRKDGFTHVNLRDDKEAISTLKDHHDVSKIEFAPTGKIIWERTKADIIIQPKSEFGKFKVGDRVRKIRGSQWRGKIVGAYSTELTVDGYVVESDSHKGSCQIYPASALEIL